MRAGSSTAAVVTLVGPLAGVVSLRLRLLLLVLVIIGGGSAV